MATNVVDRIVRPEKHEFSGVYHQVILLYNPPSSAQRKPIVPNSLLALATQLEGRHAYRIIDGNLETDERAKLSRAVLEPDVKILAVTVMPGPQLRHAVPLCRDLKVLRPDLEIVWGGYFPTQHFEACLDSGFVDYVVRGHGEFVFRDLVATLSRREDVSSIPGLAYRSADTREVRHAPMGTIPDPDQLPELPYHAVPMNRYARMTFLGERTYSYHSSYGCPFKCNFCAVVNLVDGRWLAQSAQRTAGGVEKLVNEWGADAIEFHDNNFFVSEKRTSEFSERIRNLGISWWGEARIDTLLHYSDQTWNRMKSSGLRMVFLGAESGSNETLRRMDKGGSASVEQTLQLAGRMASFGVIPEFSFVVGNPPDPEEDTENTIRFIRKLKAINPESEIILYLYTPVPLSGDLYDSATANGFEFPSTLEEWVNRDWQEFSQRRSGRLPWVPRSVTRRLRNFERVLNAYYPTCTDQRLTPVRRRILRLASSWRYHLGFYGWPLDLKLSSRLIPYQRPETSGF